MCPQRSPGGEHGNPLQYSCLENPYGQRSLAGYGLHCHKESDMTEQRGTAQHRWNIYKIEKNMIIIKAGLENYRI